MFHSKYTPHRQPSEALIPEVSNSICLSLCEAGPHQIFYETRVSKVIKCTNDSFFLIFMNINSDLADDCWFYSFLSFHKDRCCQNGTWSAGTCWKAQRRWRGNSHPKAPPPVPEGPSHPCEDGQHDDSGVYQIGRGRLRSRWLHMLACRLILWICNQFLSLRANLGADMLSRGTPMYGKWTLYHAVVEQIWVCYRRASRDLFMSWENAQCATFFRAHSFIGRDR